MPEFFDARSRPSSTFPNASSSRVLGLAGTGQSGHRGVRRAARAADDDQFRRPQYLAGGDTEMDSSAGPASPISLCHGRTRAISTTNAATAWSATRSARTARRRRAGRHRIFRDAEAPDHGGLSYRRIEAEDHIYFRGGYVMIDRMGFSYTKKNTGRRLWIPSKWAVYLQTSYPLTARLKATAGVRDRPFRLYRPDGDEPAARA